MNKFYRKPKPETMKANRESNQELYSKEIEWCKGNLELIKDDKFLVDMYTILITGSRKMTPKMVEAIRKGMKNPMYDTVKRIERMDKIKPILEKIEFIHILVEDTDKDKNEYFKVNYSALGFVKSVKSQLMKNGKLSEKQMKALNKVYKRYTKGSKNETDKKDSGKKTG
jgi:hypothetical protein|tara:strand:- start:366 stop:872 length:507 start_codon:yes stop_codon:yes gene_type:complete